MASWIEGTIIPALPNLRWRTRDEWAFLLLTLRQADNDAKDDLLLFGDRLKPEIYEQLLEIRRGITRAFQAYELYESVLGGPDEQKFVTPDMHIYTMFEIGRQHRRLLPEVIETVTDAAVETAVEVAEHILMSAVRLLQATIPLLPTEDRSSVESSLFDRVLLAISVGVNDSRAPVRSRLFVSGRLERMVGVQFMGGTSPHEARFGHAGVRVGPLVAADDREQIESTSHGDPDMPSLPGRH